MNRNTRSSAGLLILSAVLGACGGAGVTPPAGGPGQSSLPVASAGQGQTSPATGASTAPSAGPAIDACALITEKEAAAFLGSDPGPGVSTGTGSAPACAYGASLTIGIDPTGGKAAFDASMSSVPGSANGHVINGVGDGAVATIVANAIASMGILKGSVIVTVNVQGDPSLQNITVDALTTLGKTIVGRL